MRRADRRSFCAHPGMIERLGADRALMVTGVSASESLRLGLIDGPDRVEAYVGRHEVDVV